MFQKCTGNDTRHDSWHLIIKGKEQSLIRKCGRVIDGSYNSLLDSLAFNGHMVKKVLTQARSLANPTEQPQIGVIMDSPFISGLVVAINISANIFDVFLAMRQPMIENEWDDLFGSLLNSLLEYLQQLDCPVDSIDEFTDRILKTIYGYSSVGKRENSTLLVSKRMLIQQYEKLQEQKYRMN